MSSVIQLLVFCAVHLWIFKYALPRLVEALRHDLPRLEMVKDDDNEI